MAPRELVMLQDCASSRPVRSFPKEMINESKVEEGEGGTLTPGNIKVRAVWRTRDCRQTTVVVQWSVMFYTKFS